MSGPYSNRGDSANRWQNETSETTRLLSDSLRIARETEDVGEKAAQDLIAQREILDKSRSFLDSIIDIGDSARESIQAIRAKAYQRKMNLWMIIALLFVFNVYVLYLRWENDGSLFPKKS